MTRRWSHLRKRAGRNPGAEKMAEHQRIEQLFAGREVGSSQGIGGVWLLSASPLTEQDLAGYQQQQVPARERDEESALGE